MAQLANMRCVAARLSRCRGVQTAQAWESARSLARPRAFATTTQPIQVSQQALKARQPKRLQQTDVFALTPPEDLTPETLAKLGTDRVITDPAKILRTYQKHLAGSGDEGDVAVLVRCMVQLGFLFDHNSFFASADKQFLTTHRDFRCLAHDLSEAVPEIPSAAAPVLIYALTCLEYRCPALLAPLLDIVEKNMSIWRIEVLSMMLHSVTLLGLDSSGQEAIRFDLKDGESRDYGQIARLIALELAARERGDRGDFDGGHPEGSLHDWSRAAFSLVMGGHYDIPCGTDPSGFLLPALVANACAEMGARQDLDASGWAQFFLYQTLYCVDVEKPACEDAVKRSIPMWIQERLHQRWLDSIVLSAQPQGADKMQRDLDASLQRTNTQALLNCSVGREWDEQHCWFAGFLLEPKTALECDSMLPLGPGRPQPSGWLRMKSRLLKKMGYTVVTMHRCFWDKLTEDQKDEQMRRLRVQIGYQHDDELQKRMAKIRQTPHTYKGLEPKKKSWEAEPQPPSE